MQNEHQQIGRSGDLNYSALNTYSLMLAGSDATNVSCSAVSLQSQSCFVSFLCCLFGEPHMGFATCCPAHRPPKQKSKKDTM